MGNTKPMKAAGRRKQADQRRLMLMILIGAPVVFVLALVVILSQSSQPTPSAEVDYADLPQRTLDTGQPVLGRPDAPVMLFEYSNFSCPGCMQYAITAKEIIRRRVTNGQAQIAFMPLVFGYGDDPSFIAAQAALCAIPQNGFWQMHDALFDLHRTRGRSAFTPDTVRETAAALGLDADKIAQCVASGDTAGIVESAIQSARDRGVQVTPTLLYSLDGGQTIQPFTQPDGAPYVGGPPLEMVEQVINRTAQGG
ncbi:MAG: thioredoxin domain-containing protein [Anaerolineae bacterium]|nr:thioredoxin domain-containing protein [Anaerolineae bacterium]